MLISNANLRDAFRCKYRQVEKRPNSQGTAIVSMVVAGSQADEAGLMRGDILCFAGSEGKEKDAMVLFYVHAGSNNVHICESCFV